MKVIKNGKIDNKQEKFVCNYCGCVFIADKTEYCLANHIESVHDNIKAKCNCPTCGKLVYKYDSQF